MAKELKNVVNDLTEDTSPDNSADFLMTYDSSASELKKVKPATILSSGVSSFSTIAVSGQSNVVADSNTDTLTLANGDNISITTNATTDTITINNHLWDSAGDHYLVLDVDENLSANRTLKLTVGDGARDLQLLGDLKVNADGAVLKSAGIFVSVRNETGSTIAKGSPVYISGSSNGKPLVTLATSSTEVGSSKTLGVAAEAISTSSNGTVVTSGELIGTSTSPFDTSSYAAGDKLWLGSTAGSVTTTKPSAPNHAVFIGTVVKSNSTEGIVLYQVQNGYEIDELHDVLITSKADKDVLYYDNATSLWKNGKIGTSSLGGDITTAGKALLDDADAAAQRATLGLGSIATQSSSNVSITGGTISGITGLALGDSSIVFEGSVADDFETTLTVVNPSADRTLTLPDATDTLVGRATADTFTNKTFDTAGSGNVFKVNGNQITSYTGSGALVVLSSSPSFSVGVNFNGSGSGQTTVQAASTASGTLTLPAATDTLVGKATTDTLTNKSIDLASNTLTFTSAQLKTACSDETGSGGSLVFATGPTITTPTIAQVNASADFTVDAAGDIILDADGADIFLKDNAVTYGALSQSAGELQIKSGSTPTTAITLSGANVSIAGDLTVNGTTVTVNSTTVTVDDPIITLGGDTAPSVDDNKDRGVEFRWHNGSAAKVGFFGFDDSSGRLTFIPDATNSSEVFSGTVGAIDVLDVYLNGTASTGSGGMVRATSPTLVTPTLGAASATSINKLAITAPATGSTLTIADGKTLTVSNTLTMTGTDSSSVAFGAGGTVAYTGGTLAQFAATTSSQLAGVLSDETGSGSLVFATSPTLVTPILGAATATSINKVAITQPAAGSTLTIADGKTLTVSNSLTFTGTDSSSVAFGTGGTVAYTGGTLAQFAATTSSQLAGVISDETGSGALVFGTSPTFTTSVLTGSTTLAVFNTTATTVNAFGAGTAISIGAATGTTTVNNALSVSGTLKRSVSTTINLNTATTVASFDGSVYRSGEFLIQLTQGSKYRVSKVTVLHNGTTADSAEYGVLELGGTMSGIDVTAAYSAGTINVTVTVTDAATTNVSAKVFATQLAV